MSNYSLKEITAQVERAAKKHYGATFKFRPNQKEAVVNAVYNWLTGAKDDVILQGPTGSGKSAIGLLAAAVLSEDYGKTGYILISDLSLIKQYERDCGKFFKGFAVIRGQQTYTCLKNHLPFRSGVCQLAGCKSYKQIKSKYPCYQACEYIIDRERAIESDVCICTYSFWLIQQNVVRPKIVDGVPPFGKRDFVICDEAHKLVGIVQSHFSPTLGKTDFAKFRSVVDAVNPDDDDSIYKAENIKLSIKRMEDNDTLLDSLREYVRHIDVIADAADVIKRSLAEKIAAKVPLDKDDRMLASNAEFVRDHAESFHEYINIIGDVGTSYMVKNPSGDNIVFNCLDESYLMKKYFHDNCGYKMYMSATIGDFSAFARSVAIPDYMSIDIPSTFDFTNSPIFYVDKYRLSYKEKEQSLPKIIEMINGVVGMYKDRRGIIQTGSYDFAKRLYNSAPPAVRKRLILYDDSKEKDEAIVCYKKYDDRILVGPSLVEGLSFDDDLCRFQIVMKVPYPSLADRFVKAKKDLSPEWYSNMTAISILQGVGRGVRSERDWCVTFILDGCFTYLSRSSRSMFPADFVKRIRMIKPTDLGVVG